MNVKCSHFPYTIPLHYIFSFPTYSFLFPCICFKFEPLRGVVYLFFYNKALGIWVTLCKLLVVMMMAHVHPFSDIPASNMSILIKIHIPSGQRPTTEELEKRIPAMQGLEEIIRLMKRCWHNDKVQRPSFRGKHGTPPPQKGRIGLC